MTIRFKCPCCGVEGPSSDFLPPTDRVSIADSMTGVNKSTTSHRKASRGYYARNAEAINKAAKAKRHSGQTHKDTVKSLRSGKGEVWDGLEDLLRKSRK